MASSICLVNGSPIPIASDGVTGVNVLPGATVTVALLNSAGVNAWNCFCTSTDGYNPLSTTTLINSTIINNLPAYSLTFVAPLMTGAAGSAMQWTSIVNPGPEQQSTTFGIFVLCSSGLRLFFIDENLESNSTYGVAYDLNKTLIDADIFLAGGDLSGSSTSQTVIALQGNAVKSGTLIASQDGYVLTWHNASSQWEALPETIAFIAGGDLPSQRRKHWRGALSNGR